ncbi:MAG: biotin/lipoyl-containing protein, partial [Povalibacter sp.]
MPQITVPDLGDFHDVEVIDILVKPGDQIDVDTPLLTLETEKATMDVPSTSTGVVKSLVVKKGDRVSKGSVILEIEGAASAPAKAEAAKPVTQPKVEAAPAQSAPAPKASGGGVADVAVPDLGDFHDVEVIDVLVKPGDKIAVDTPLLTLETEKATMDVPSTGTGVVKSIVVKKGDRVSKGSVILQIESEGTATSASPTAPPAAAKAAPAPAAPSPAPSAPAPVPSAPAARQSAPVDEVAFARAYASPSVRRFA